MGVSMMSVFKEDSCPNSDEQEKFQEIYQKDGDKTVHTVVVAKSAECNKLGLDIYVSARDQIKRITKVKDEGLIARHNKANPQQGVFEDDGVESVNGVAWPQKLFFEEIANAQT